MSDDRQGLMKRALVARRQWQAGRWAHSIPLLEDIVQADPDVPHGHRDLGIALQRSGRLEEAGVSLRRALDLAASAGPVPETLGLARAFAELGRALEAEGRDKAAALAYRDAARAATNPGESGHYLATALMVEGVPEAAEAVVRKVLADAPDRVGSRLLLGHVLSQRGCFGEAAGEFTRAIALAPDHPLGFEALTTVRRMTEADRPLIDLIRALAGQPGLDKALALGLQFGLGKAFDDLDEPAAAMAHYDAGNRLRAASQRLNRPLLARRNDDLIAAFTAPVLDNAARVLAQAAGPSDTRPIFIVGLPRCGSTLVEQVLSSHPMVAAGGELPFWSERQTHWYKSGQHRPDAAAFALAARDYGEQLSRIAPGAARVTDKALHNFVLLWAIRIALPHARIIHCRRHPVDTCLSIYFTNFRARHDYAWDRGDLVFYYREYERLMAHWRRVLPKNRFLEVSYEAMVGDREAETRRLITFCGLPWDEACLTPEHNNRVAGTASRWQVRQPVYASSVGRWRRYAPWLGELQELLV